jgi:hypothetical protein
MTFFPSVFFIQEFPKGFLLHKLFYTLKVDMAIKSLSRLKKIKIKLKKWAFVNELIILYHLLDEDSSYQLTLTLYL